MDIQRYRPDHARDEACPVAHFLMLLMGFSQYLANFLLFPSIVRQRAKKGEWRIKENDWAILAIGALYVK